MGQYQSIIGGFSVETLGILGHLTLNKEFKFIVTHSEHFQNQYDHMSQAYSTFKKQKNIGTKQQRQALRDSAILRLGVYLYKESSQNEKWVWERIRNLSWDLDDETLYKEQMMTFMQ